MFIKSLQLVLSNFRNLSHEVNAKTFFIIQCRKYARFAPRAYRDIVNADELFDIEENTTPPMNDLPKKSKLKSARATDFYTQEETPVENVKEKPIQPKTSFSTKLYDNEKKMASLMMSLKSKKQRKKNSQIIIEGKRLIQEAIKVGLVPQTLIFSRYEDVKDLPISKTDTQLYKVPYRTIQVWSTLSTTPGIMGIFNKPEPIQVSSKLLPITIVCDNIRDPRNMGSILRAAAGVGCEKVLLTKGCVDFWDTKVMRSATGAQFRVPIFGGQTWDEIVSSIGSDAQIFIADNNVDPFKVIDEDTGAKPQIVEKNKKSEVLTRLNELQVLPYYNADYTKNEVVLIVGGETEGLSMESVELTKSRDGVRVNIPLNNDIDSLNAGMAIGIVVFEVKRQFSKKLKDSL